MDKIELKEKLARCKELAASIKSDMWNTVFPEKLEDIDQFESLPRQERTALIGILQNASDLLSNISLYESWFLK